MRAVTVALEAVGATCATLNVVFFAHKALEGSERRARRVASSAMALVSLGAVLQGLAWVAAPPEGEAAAWAVIRLPSLLGTMVVSLLVLRRLAAE